MFEQSVIIHQHNKRAWVGGLSWQPISSTGYSNRISEIRDLAERVDASKHVQVQANQGLFAGFYNFDAEMSEEKRPRKIYSIAAWMAATYPSQNCILLWRISIESQRKSDIALVVIEEGAPVLDMVCNLTQAISTVQAYSTGAFQSSPYKLYTNDPALVADAEIVEPNVLDSASLKGLALIDIPVDLIKASGLLGGILLVGAALYGGNFYLDVLERAEKMKSIQQQSAASIQTPAYLSRLSIEKLNAGMGARDAIELINTLVEQPFAAKGWQLQDIQCELGRCTSFWKSEAGYTEELISFLGNQKVIPDFKLQDQLTFEFEYSAIQAKAFPSLDQLPKKEDIKNLLYQEKQAWTKAELNHNVSIEGAMWPEGFNNVPPNMQVFKHPVTASGSLPVIKDFLQRYGQDTYWKKIIFKVNPSSLDQAITLTVEGAFYAY